MLSPLRERLQQITEDLRDERLPEQIAAIEALRRQIPHSVTLEAPADPAKPHICYEYALGLADRPPLVRGLDFPNSPCLLNCDFLSYLVDADMLVEVDEQKPKDDDLIIYRRCGIRFTHAGAWRAGAVTSKWGRGHLWRHPPEEVPVSYGDEWFFCEPIPRDRVLAALRAYAERYAPEDARVADVLALVR
jgi:hypothetical protein